LYQFFFSRGSAEVPVLQLVMLLVEVNVEIVVMVQ
jgi:hypothetical protein